MPPLATLAGQTGPTYSGSTLKSKVALTHQEAWPNMLLLWKKQHQRPKPNLMTKQKSLSRSSSAKGKGQAKGLEKVLTQKMWQRSLRLLMNGRKSLRRGQRRWPRTGRRPRTMRIFDDKHIRSSSHLFAPLLDIFPYAQLAHLNLQDCTWPTLAQWMDQGQKTFWQWSERMETSTQISTPVGLTSSPTLGTT